VSPVPVYESKTHHTADDRNFDISKRTTNCWQLLIKLRNYMFYGH